MQHTAPNWKANWEETKQHFCQWWQHTGPVLVIWGLPELSPSRDATPAPPRPSNPAGRHTDPKWFAWAQRHWLARCQYPADNLPLAHVDYGCVQLAACFGSEPFFEDDTVWYNDCIADPATCPPLRLDKTQRWWRTYDAILQEVVRVSGGDFIVGAPAFGSNLDVLAELRGTQNLMYDFTDHPGWLHEKLEEINQAFFEAFDHYYERIRLADGSSAYTHFMLWGPGKTSQVQCDNAAMISPDMFQEFVVPPLRRQCAWLDNSLFHLDGSNCICHLDHLLAIDELDAVQWTPGEGQPGAGDRKWFDLYRRVLAAGKSVQILGANLAQACDVLDTFGGKGVYLGVNVKDEREAATIIGRVDKLRSQSPANLKTHSS